MTFAHSRCPADKNDERPVGLPQPVPGVKIIGKQFSCFALHHLAGEFVQRLPINALGIVLGQSIMDIPNETFREAFWYSADL